VKAENRLRGRRNRAVGNQCEAIVHRALEHAGAQLVEAVHTPWRIQRGMRQGRSVIIGATPMQKVSGDFRAVLPSGRSVLCEVKHREGRLVFSDFEKHQREALTNHSAAGGCSLIAWVVLEPATTCWLMPWDLVVALGFRERTSLTPEQAEAMTLRARGLLA
jgi:hypothetical protein